MGMPIATAVLGLATALGLIGLLGHLLAIPTVGPTLATMIGLGVGIDYALFVASLGYARAVAESPPCWRRSRSCRRCCRPDGTCSAASCRPGPAPGPARGRDRLAPVGGGRDRPPLACGLVALALLIPLIVQMLSLHLG
jgi:hypothetical protein